jgi:hypothetical protein
MTVVVVVVANLEFLRVKEFPARRGGIGSRCIRRSSLRVVVTTTVVAMTVVVVVVASLEFLREFANSDGVGNRRSDGSSSENECNGEFDLNHVE